MVKKIVFLIVTFLFSFELSYCYSQSCDSIMEMGFPFESVPVFNGDLRAFIQNSIIYPKGALKDSIEGKVYVSYVVDTMGFTTDNKVVKGVRKDLNEEALRITRLIKYEEPAMLNGKPIEFKYTVPVIFKLSDKDSINKHKR